MKLDAQQWRLSPCGNPEHGPEHPCWSVKDDRGAVIANGLTRDVAMILVTVPEMARALLDGHAAFECLCTASAPCPMRSALAKAGVPMP